MTDTPQHEFICVTARPITKLEGSGQAEFEQYKMLATGVSGKKAATLSTEAPFFGAVAGRHSVDGLQILVIEDPNHLLFIEPLEPPQALRHNTQVAIFHESAEAPEAIDDRPPSVEERVPGSTIERARAQLASFSATRLAGAPNQESRPTRSAVGPAPISASGIDALSAPTRIAPIPTRTAPAKTETQNSVVERPLIVDPVGVGDSEAMTTETKLPKLAVGTLDTAASEARTGESTAPPLPSTGEAVFLPTVEATNETDSPDAQTAEMQFAPKQNDAVTAEVEMPKPLPQTKEQKLPATREFSLDDVARATQDAVEEPTMQVSPEELASMRSDLTSGADDAHAAVTKRLSPLDTELPELLDD